MNEIERAIEHIADNVRFLRTHPYVDDSLKHHELALTALKEKLEREKNPLTCEGCKNQEGMYVDDNQCYDCRRYTTLSDHYKPKGEKS